MGRSVMTYGDNNIYLHIDTTGTAPDLEGFDCHDWDMFYENIYDVLSDKYPSLDNVIDDSKWCGSEGRVIAQNSFAEIVVCSYFNVVSINICVRDDAYDYNLENIAQAWCNRVQDNFAKALKDADYDVVMRVATMSNGVSIFGR
jgi:hypothetical protein